MIRRARRAFSLIELLVVISIISVLIALLLPALSGAHEQARRTKCLSQTQQMGECMGLYINDFRDAFPLMPGPAPALANQFIYGGLAGLFSLGQIGDGQSVGFGSGGGGAYSNGSAEPLMLAYVSTLEILQCPSDREDRYYGFPYTPAGNMSYAAALVKRPAKPLLPRDVVSYNISYLYIAGLRADRSRSDFPVWGDETNGPDIADYAWYGSAQVPPGGSTANSTAAGATHAGNYAPVDNHGKAGGNIGTVQGSAQFTSGPFGGVNWPNRALATLD